MDSIKHIPQCNVSHSGLAAQACSSRTNSHTSIQPTPYCVGVVRYQTLSLLCHGRSTTLDSVPPAGLVMNKSQRAVKRSILSLFSHSTWGSSGGCLALQAQKICRQHLGSTAVASGRLPAVLVGSTAVAVWPHLANEPSISFLHFMLAARQC